LVTTTTPMTMMTTPTTTQITTVPTPITAQTLQMTLVVGAKRGLGQPRIKSFCACFIFGSRST